MPIIELRNQLVKKLLDSMGAGGASIPVGGDSGVMMVPPDVSDSVWEHERNHIKYGFPWTGPWSGTSAMQDFNDLWHAGKNIPQMQMDMDTKYTPIIKAHDELSDKVLPGEAVQRLLGERDRMNRAQRFGMVDPSLGGIVDGNKFPQ